MSKHRLDTYVISLKNVDGVMATTLLDMLDLPVWITAKDLVSKLTHILLFSSNTLAVTANLGIALSGYGATLLAEYDSPTDFINALGLNTKMKYTAKELLTLLNKPGTHKPLPTSAPAKGNPDPDAITHDNLIPDREALKRAFAKGKLRN